MRGWPAWTAILQYVIVWATVTTTYIMAVKNGDEPRWLPTISNTGDMRPQSAIFSLGMVLASVLLLFNIVIKYEHVNAQLDRRDPERQSLVVAKLEPQLPGLTRVADDRKWNLVALVFGVITVFGTFVIACVQDNVYGGVHNSFAFIIFVASTIYLGMLHRFTWLAPRPIYLTAIRLSLLLLAVGTFFGMLSIVIILKTPHHSNVFPIGALFEWLFVFLQQTNMLAWFFMDFRDVTVRLTVTDAA